MATNADVIQTLQKVSAEYADMKRQFSDWQLSEARKGLVKPGAYPSDQQVTPEVKSFLGFLRRGVARMDPGERKALVEDSTTGHYLVPQALEAEIFRAAAAQGTIRPLASKRTTNRDRVSVKTLAGLTASWGKLETGSLIHDTTLAPTSTDIYIEDLYALTKLGEDELSDCSDFDLAKIVAQEFAKVVASMEDAAFIAGTGHTYQQPNGITTDSTLAAAALETTGSGAILVEDILTAIYECPTEYRKGLTITVHSQSELALRKLRAGGSTSTDGPFLWQPSVQAGAPATFAGFPIYTNDNLGTLAGTQQVLAIVGNIAEGFRIFDRQGLTIQYLDQLYAESGLVAWKLHYRVGSYVIRPEDKRIVLLKEHS